MQLIGEYLSNHAILSFSMATKIMEAKDEIWNKTNHLEEMHNKPLGRYYEKGRSTLNHIDNYHQYMKIYYRHLYPIGEGKREGKRWIGICI